jgi:hypothetical protein
MQIITYLWQLLLIKSLFVADRKFRLPLNGIIFANFNKIDKLDHQSLMVWFNVSF